MMEAKLLVQLFPHLRDSFDRDELPISFILKKDAGRLTKGRGARRRKGMSAAARKAVGLRMKKYWAERRKGEEGVVGAVVASQMSGRIDLHDG
jgi:hypothetical protein